MTNMNIELDFERLKDSVLGWLSKQKSNVDRFSYNFSPTSSHSLFTSCFALFVLDLFRETDKLTLKEKLEWSEHINSYQNKTDGLYYPSDILHPDKERAVFQLTCFCLSALQILGSAPKYRLSVVDQWKSASEVRRYLFDRQVHLGKGGSGNKAMFQAIMLTHEYEKTKDELLFNCMKTWFDFHDEHQNKHGFWGANSKLTLYSGVQNSFHQFVIYDYWQRKYSNLDFIAKTVVRLQDRDGFFSPVPGGGACKDYDAIHYLLASPTTANSSQGRKVLKKALEANKKCWNDDGGFCESIYRPLQPHKTINYLMLASCGHDWSVWLTRVKHIAKDLIRKEDKKSRKWVVEDQRWNESTIWDTWFRCLCMAEITCFLEPENHSKYRFHNHIGIGFNPKYYND